MALMLVISAGLALGSFSALLGSRIPLHQPVMFARSRCDGCQRSLRIKELFPVVSFLIQKGHCNCGMAKLSWIYPTCEVMVGIAVTAVWLESRSIPLTAIMAALAVTLIALSMIDLKYLIVPDTLVCVTAALGLVWLTQDIVAFKDGIYGAALAFTITITVRYLMEKIYRKPVLGFGDIKLISALGLWTGLTGLPIFLIAAGIAGIAIGLLWKLRKSEPLFPFGPALAAGAYFTLLLQLRG